jgi:hypothetical protein
MTTTTAIALLAAGLAPSICGLFRWIAWLRLVRHVHDTAGHEALRHLPAVAAAFRTGRVTAHTARKAREP